MDFICTQSYDEMSIKAAAIISAQLINKPASVLGLATGSSPLGTYSYLSEWCSQGIIDFSQAKSINLDADMVLLDRNLDIKYVIKDGKLI